MENGIFGHFGRKSENGIECKSRRINKQVMERKRRARINASLDQIKDIVLQGLQKDPSKFEKLEKADILELTVAYLETHRQKKSDSSPQTFSTSHMSYGSSSSFIKQQAMVTSVPELPSRTMISSLDLAPHSKSVENYPQSPAAAYNISSSTESSPPQRFSSPKLQPPRSDPGQVDVGSLPFIDDWFSSQGLISTPRIIIDQQEVETIWRPW